MGLCHFFLLSSGSVLTLWLFLFLFFYQFEREDSFNGNGSLGDSIGAVER